MQESLTSILMFILQISIIFWSYVFLNLEYGEEILGDIVGYVVDKYIIRSI